MSGNSITNLPDLSNDFSVLPLGDPEGTHAVRKRWIRQNFTTLADNNLKANVVDVYTKTQNDTALALKSDKLNTFTKTEVTDAIALKANAADVYTKTDSDSKYRLIADTYTKTQLDTSLGLKADKSYVDSQDLIKANTADVYTKTQIDTSLTGKKNTGTFDTKIQHSTTNSSVDCSGAN
jgi:hypothetical protein